ncbi:MAG: NAD-dependent epimerase/dehydratase family protein, partial [Actinobacteria bacterium]|nr:NAD-dependent epimerase/dehydratase family protein [Actinomycetota bacterium]
MRVVVTGGAGFIGSNLCRHLLAAPGVSSVVVLDDLSTGNLANLDGFDVDFVHGSITDDAALDEAFAGAGAVVHLAALGSVPRSVADPMATHHANATGTAMVLEAARRHGNLHVLVASSSSVYGANPTLPKHEGLATRPLSPYAASKLATESYTLAWGRSYGLPVLAFRFFNVFGPHQPAGHVYAAVIPVFV